MKITVNEHLKLELFDKIYAEKFFDAIRSSKGNGEVFLETLQKKYGSFENVLTRIQDAVENKFKVDGTPDFFICLGDKIVGVFEFHPLSTENLIEIGFWLFPEFRKKGILTQAFPYMIEYATRHFSKEKMVATTAIDNFSAQKLLERCGFEKSGETEEKLADGIVEKQFVYELCLIKAVTY